MEALDKIESIVREAIPSAKELAEHAVKFTQYEAWTKIGIAAFIGLFGLIGVGCCVAWWRTQLTKEWLQRDEGPAIIGAFATFVVVMCLLVVSDNVPIALEPVGATVHKMIKK